MEIMLTHIRMSMFLKNANAQCSLCVIYASGSRRDVHFKSLHSLVDKQAAFPKIDQKH